MQLIILIICTKLIICTRLLGTELTLSLPSFELKCDGTYLINILDL